MECHLCGHAGADVHVSLGWVGNDQTPIALCDDGETCKRRIDAIRFIRQSVPDKANRSPANQRAA